MRPGSDSASSRSSTGYSADAWLKQIGVAPRVVEAGGGTRTPGMLGDRQNLLRLACVGLIVMVMLGPIMTISEDATAGEGSLVRQLAYMTILAVTIYAIRPVATRSSLVALSVPMLVALGWGWISTFWAIDPGVSLRRVFLVTLVAWLTFSLVRHAGYVLTLTMLRYTLLAAVLISYVVVYADPMTGIHMLRDSAMPTAITGNWRGFLGHKNFAGAVCALTIILFLFDAKGFKPALRIAVFVVVGYFLYRSQSKTSAGMLFLASLGGLLFETVSLRLRRYLIPILTLGGSLVWFLTSAYADMVSANFLNPTAFTGRGQIWSALLRYAADHPFGAGFGSFWDVGSMSPVYQYGQGYVTTITVGHSGYMDQLVTVGWPGVLLMVFALAVWPLWKLLGSQDIAPGQGALVAAMLMFCIGHNITESGLFERDLIVSVMFFFAAALAQYVTEGEKRVKASPVKAAGDDVMRAMRKRSKEGEPGSVSRSRRRAVSAPGE